MTFKDFELLRHLRLNSRKSIAKISQECNIPASSAYSRLKSCENEIIKRYTSLLNFEKMGLYAKIHLIIKIRNSSKDNFVNFLKICPNVNSIFRLKGDFDFYIEAIFKHEIDANEWVDNLKEKFHFDNLVVHHILKDIQNELFLVK